MYEYLPQYGLPALFFVSFLASTLIPLGSEWLLVAILLQQQEPVIVVATATLGNYLGSCTSYWIGLNGGSFLIRRVLKIDEKSQQKAEQVYRRYGSWSLLCSWMPLIGDPLCLVGGILKAPFGTFSLLVFSGKLARYAVVAWLAVAGRGLFPQ